MTEMCISAANYIIRQVNENYKGVFMSSKRLQKLLFFSDVLYMTRHDGQSMFDDEYYAWPSGPVIPDVYDTFMQYQSGIMLPYDEKNHTLTDEGQTRTIDAVLEDTKDKDTVELVNRSHRAGGPWDEMYDEANPKHDDLISKRSIFNYYLKHGAPYGTQN